MSHKTNYLPRFLRLRDAPHYLGMDPNRFRREVRPHLTEIRIGIQGVAFDRIDLDEFAEEYKRCNGRPSKLKGEALWDAQKPQDCANAPASGTSTNRSQVHAFAQALERVASSKRN